MQGETLKFTKFRASRHIFIKAASIKFNVNLSSESPVYTCGETDRRIGRRS